MSDIERATIEAEEAIVYAALGELNDDEAAEVYAALALLVTTGAIEEHYMSGEGVTVRVGGAA